MNRTQERRIRKWIRALRSGKYTQGQGALRKGDTFCCLGVACELAVDAGIISAAVPPNVWPNTYTQAWLYDNVSIDLPTSVVQWMGLKGHDGIGQFRWTGYGNEMTDLIRMNDDDRSFSEIADAIERWLDSQIAAA